MDNFINGINTKLEIDIGEGFKPIACLTENSFSENSEMLETTTNENGGWKTSIPVKQGYSISLSGLSINTIYNGDNTKYSYDTLKLLKRNKTLINYKMTNVVNGDIDTGQAYINSLNSIFNIDEFISFDCTLEGFGIPISSNETPLDSGLESILEILI